METVVGDGGVDSGEAGTATWYDGVVVALISPPWHSSEQMEGVGTVRSFSAGAVAAANPGTPTVELALLGARGDAACVVDEEPLPRKS